MVSCCRYHTTIGDKSDQTPVHDCNSACARINMTEFAWLDPRHPAHLANICSVLLSPASMLSSPLQDRPLVHLKHALYSSCTACLLILYPNLFSSCTLLSPPVVLRLYSFCTLVFIPLVLSSLLFSSLLSNPLLSTPKSTPISTPLQKMLSTPHEPYHLLLLYHILYSSSNTLSFQLPPCSLFLFGHAVYNSSTGPESSPILVSHS